MLKRFCKNWNTRPSLANIWQLRLDTKKCLVRLGKCHILSFWSRLRFGVMDVCVSLSGMKGWWSVIVGEWVELYLCWTGCPWFCWLSGYIQTGTWQQACNTRPGQPTKDAQQVTNKQTKKQKSIRKNVTKKDIHWVWNKLNHFHRWNHIKHEVCRYQKMFFFPLMKPSVGGDHQLNRDRLMEIGSDVPGKPNLFWDWGGTSAW